MRNLHTAVIALFVVVALALASPFSRSHVVSPVSQPLTGTYLTEQDDEMSWIKLVELPGNKVRCDWRKLKLMTDGKVTRQGFIFEGTIKGDRISMQAVVNKAKRFIIYADAVRENGTIRLSMAMEGMTFYAGRYNPSGLVELGRTQARFVRQGQDLIAARKDAITANTPPAELALMEQIKKDTESVRQGNQHITALREFREQYPKTIRQFERNTISIGRYLEQVHGAQQMGRRVYVTQSYMQMQDVLNQTYIMQNEQDAFREYIARDVKPFIVQMQQKQGSCAGQNVSAEAQAMCKAAASLEKSLNTQLSGVEKIFEEIRASYRKNAALQRKAIDEARQVVNPDAVKDHAVE